MFFVRGSVSSILMLRQNQLDLFPTSEPEVKGEEQQAERFLCPLRNDL